MHGQMPQEIEVWYIIPALRKALSHSLVHDYQLSQKQVAQIMGVTPAAISQYESSKRAKQVQFNKEVLKSIHGAAGRLINQSAQLIPELIQLTKLAAVKETMCSLHKQHAEDVPHDCNVCFEPNLIQIK